jgi:tripartite ATP-independent transporter DctM subunit
MSDLQLLSLVVGISIAMLFLGHPIALTFGAIGIILGWIFIGPAVMQIAVMKTYAVMVSFPLMAIPLFIFMAFLLEKGGVAESMFDGIRDLFGHLPGGLAIAVTVVCTLFAASTGIIGATIVSMGVMAGPYLLDHGYDRRLTVGTIMAGGTLGIIIPPSVLLIVLGSTAGISIGQLFVGAVIPGLLMSLFYMIYIYVRCRINPSLGPPVPIEELDPLKIRLVRGAKKVTPPVLLILVVLGSLFVGIATPSEAGAIGAFAAFLLMVGYGRFTFENFHGAVRSTVKASCMVMFIIVGVNIFSAVFMALGCGKTLGSLFIALDSKWLFIWLTMLLIFILGMIIDWTAILMLLVPIFFPIAMQYDINLFWFAMIISINLQTSFLSPPFGYALFFMKSLKLPGVGINDIYWSVIPFILMQFLVLILTMMFPQIVTYLTNLVFVP